MNYNYPDFVYFWERPEVPGTGEGSRLESGFSVIESLRRMGIAVRPDLDASMQLSVARDPVLPSHGVEMAEKTEFST
jgi:hypothetical protein